MQSLAIDKSGSFSSPRQFERSPGAKVASTVTGTIVQKLEKVIHSPENNEISEGGYEANIHASTWNVSDVLSGSDFLAFKRASIMGQGQATVL